MAPKVESPEAAVSIENFRFVLDVVESAEQFTPVWAIVAEKHGIGYPKNA